MLIRLIPALMLTRPAKELLFWLSFALLVRGLTTLRRQGGPNDLPLHLDRLKWTLLRLLRDGWRQ